MSARRNAGSAGGEAADARQEDRAALSRPGDFLSRLAEDCVWTVGTDVFRGREEIVAFFRRVAELSDGSYGLEPLWELDDGERGVFYYRARGSRPDGRTIDIDQAALFRLGPDGRYAEVRILPFDQEVFDAFWA